MKLVKWIFFGLAFLLLFMIYPAFATFLTNVSENMTGAFSPAATPLETAFSALLPFLLLAVVVVALIWRFKHGGSE